jgi:hypothetical protein
MYPVREPDANTRSPAGVLGFVAVCVTVAAMLINWDS